MSKHLAAPLAWTCWVLTLAFICAQLVLQRLNSSSTVANDVFGTLEALAFATIALLIAARRPENLIGWVLAAGTLLSEASGSMIAYSEYGLLIAPGSLPAPLWIAVLGGLLRTSGFILMLLVVLLLFPDGKLPSPRWRWAARVLALSAILNCAGTLFDPDMSDVDLKLAAFRHPLGDVLPQPISGALSGLGLLSLGLGIVACVAALVVRFRRSRGDERQQLKWLTYSGFFSAAIFLLVLVGVFLNLDFINSSGGFLFQLLLIPIPIAVAIAVLKYRLYDIDAIVNRTLVYAALTAMLGLVYWGGVAALQQILRPISGEGNDLAVVATTLLIAALFLPLRARIQGFIDRRFYRRKYDSARTLAAFGQVARDEVDLSTLTGRLVEVVQETVQPDSISLWLSTDHGPRGARR